MAFWNIPRTQNKKVEYNFGMGINDEVTPIKLNDNELSTALNVSSTEYPSICSRNQRFFPFQLIRDDVPLGSTGGSTSFNGLHCLDGYYTLTVEDSVLRYYQEAVITSTATINGYKTALKTVNNLPAKMIDFNNGTETVTLFTNTVSTDNYYISETTPPSSTQSGVVAATTWIQTDVTYPFSLLMESFKNRVFSAKEKTLYYSALSNINDWTTAGDAGQIILGDARSDITSIVEYNDKLVIFTQYDRYELFGDSPDNFQIVKTESGVGCIDDKSVVKSDAGFLYFASLDGIYEYNGSTVRKISSKIQKTYLQRTINSSVSCGFHEDRLYVSVSSLSFSFVYDTRYDSWYFQSGTFSYYEKMRGGSKGVPIQFNNVNFNLYDKFIVAEDSTSELNSLKLISKNTFAGVLNESSNVDWYFETKAYNEAISRLQVLYEINISYEGTTNSFMNISYTTNVNDSTYTVVASSALFTMDGQVRSQSIIMPSSVVSGDKWYKLKVSGEGRVAVHGIEKWYRVRE